MTLFFEASALASVYLKEARTPVVLPLFRQSIPIISRLTVTETVSAICAAQRNNRLRLAQRDLLIRAFTHDLEHMGIVEISPTTATMAHELLLKWPLKSSDSLQLGSFALVHQRYSDGITLICGDERIVTAAEGEHLPVVRV